MIPNKRLTGALNSPESQILAGATVDVVNASSVDLTLLGQTVTNVPVLDTGYSPAVGDVVSVLRSKDRLLVLGPVATSFGG